MVCELPMCFSKDVDSFNLVLNYILESNKDMDYFEQSDLGIDWFTSLLSVSPNEGIRRYENKDLDLIKSSLIVCGYYVGYLIENDRLDEVKYVLKEMNKFFDVDMLDIFITPHIDIPVRKYC